MRAAVGAQAPGELLTLASDDLFEVGLRKTERRERLAVDHLDAAFPEGAHAELRGGRRADLPHHDDIERCLQEAGDS